jgi:hypothetical protein
MRNVTLLVIIIIIIIGGGGGGGYKLLHALWLSFSMSLS